MRPTAVGHDEPVRRERVRNSLRSDASMWNVHSARDVARGVFRRRTAVDNDELSDTLVQVVKHVGAVSFEPQPVLEVRRGIGR